LDIQTHFGENPNPPNANQLAHVANASGMASEQSIQEMLRLTKETWHLVKEEW